MNLTYKIISSAHSVDASSIRLTNWTFFSSQISSLLITLATCEIKSLHLSSLLYSSHNPAPNFIAHANKPLKSENRLLFLAIQ
jgi:hypothetical protein